MLRAKFLLVCLPAVLLSLVATAAQADTLINFESPTYTVGDLHGQDNWVDDWGAGHENVINTDASSGLQSVLTVKGTSADRALNDTYHGTAPLYFSMDLKAPAAAYADGAVGLEVTLKGSAGRSFTDRTIQFGFYSNHLYAWSENGEVGGASGSIPSPNQWVTLWGKFYDAGGGNRKADLGWCALNQTPFVDGQLITGYDAKDYDVSYLLLEMGTDAITGVGWDNVRVGSTIPEPCAIVLLAMGFTGLLAYAWRRRK
jgi:hypothetical protein